MLWHPLCYHIIFCACTVTVFCQACTALALEMAPFGAIWERWRMGELMLWCLLWASGNITHPSRDSRKLLLHFVSSSATFLPMDATDHLFQSAATGHQPSTLDHMCSELACKPDPHNCCSSDIIWFSPTSDESGQLFSRTAFNSWQSYSQ